MLFNELQIWFTQSECIGFPYYRLPNISTGLLVITVSFLVATAKFVFNLFFIDGILEKSIGVAAGIVVGVSAILIVVGVVVRKFVVKKGQVSV